MHEYVGNVHMHTPYSDGQKYHAALAADAASAGLDFVIVTDHNIWVDGLEGYYQHDNGSVLLLVGEEVHDSRRQPQANHFLALGADRELAPFAANPQELIDKTNEAGGYGFLAHPFDPAAPKFGEPALPWVAWDIDGYAGLEIWNYMSSFKGELTSLPKTLLAAFKPERYVTAPDAQTLARWDELLAAGKRVMAIGGSDAHGQTYSLGPISRPIFPYEFLFRTVNVHILIEEALSGDLNHDKQLVLDAIGRGRSWVGYDLPGSTAGFRFSGQSRDKGIMGDALRMDAGATLQVRTPDKCLIRIIANGAVVSEAEDESTLTHLPIAEGAYRVECYRQHQGRRCGWIFSNPIYLV